MANETRDQPRVRCLQNLILYYHRLTAHGQKATAELLMGKWHWSWTLNRFQNFYNQNLTHRPTQIHAVIILLFLGRQPNDTRLSIPNSRNLPELIKLVSQAGRHGPGGGASVFYWLLTHSASYSSEAFKMFSKHTSLNHNVNSIY